MVPLLTKNCIQFFSGYGNDFSGFYKIQQNLGARSGWSWVDTTPNSDEESNEDEATFIPSTQIIYKNFTSLKIRIIKLLLQNDHYSGNHSLQ